MSAAATAPPLAPPQARALPGDGAKLDSLQVLRGVAAWMVVLYHTGSLYAVHTGQVLWGNVFRSGFTGVEVFFVLSGVVIYWVHGRDVGHPERARSFLVRRAFRLFPVYWVVVALKVAKDPAAVSLGTLLTAIFLLPAAPPFINVSWTLTYELFFYSAFLIWLLQPASRWAVWPMLLLVLLAICPVPAALSPPAVPPGSALHIWVSFLFNPHLMVFVFGVAVAWWLQRKGPLAPGLARALVAVGVLCFVAAAVAGTVLANGVMLEMGATAHDVAEMRSNAVFDLGVWLFGVPTALAVLGLLSLELQGRLRVPFKRALTWLGDISYSLYLTHAFVIHLALSQSDFRALAAAQPLALLAVWALALGIAWVLYRSVEVPAMRWGRRFAKPARPAVAAG